MRKTVWTSKTFWVNTIALLAMLAQSQLGHPIPPEAQMAALAMVNMVLRMVTKEPITWSAPPPGAKSLVFCLLLAAGLSGCITDGIQTTAPISGVNIKITDPQGGRQVQAVVSGDASVSMAPDGTITGTSKMNNQVLNEMLKAGVAAAAGK